MVYFLLFLVLKVWILFLVCYFLFIFMKVWIEDFFNGGLILEDFLLYCKCCDIYEVYFCFGLLVFKGIFRFDVIFCYIYRFICGFRISRSYVRRNVLLSYEFYFVVNKSIKCLFWLIYKIWLCIWRCYWNEWYLCLVV